MNRDGTDDVIVGLYRDGFARIDAFADRAEVGELRRLMFPAVRRAIESKSNLAADVVPPRRGAGRVMQLSVFDYVRGNEAEEHRFKVSVGADGTLSLAR